MCECATIYHNNGNYIIYLYEASARASKDSVQGPKRFCPVIKRFCHVIKRFCQGMKRFG
jgi:hypothetical protein